MKYLTKKQQDIIIKEIKDGNPFNTHIAKLANCNYKTVRRYRRHIETGTIPMSFEENKT